MQSTWLEIRTPPAPYLYAFRKTTNRALHVIVAIKQSRDGFEAYSILDHGTIRKTIRKERKEKELQLILDSIFDICDRYAETEPSGDSSTPMFSYIDSTGKINGTASRADLFDLVERRSIGWESQVWNFAKSSGGWESLNQAIGFAQIE